MIDQTRALLDYINASPTPYHCVLESCRQLDAAGFSPLDNGARWDLEANTGYYVAQGGALVAFITGSRPAIEGGFRLIGAHTDSPNLRLKPQPDVRKAGFVQLGVEVYGGVLDYTWLDRDLGLAGRVMLRGAGGATDLETRYVDLRRPLLRVPSLAIHLNRTVNKEGLKLNRQKHLAPVLGLVAPGDTAAPKGEDAPEVLRLLLGEAMDVAPDTILGWDLSVVDVVPATLGGWREEFVFAPRLDNQASCHAALAALLASNAQGEAEGTAVICLHDHEEVGSQTSTGADGPLVEWTLRRIAAAGDPQATETSALARAIARSYQVSADMAHAVHPNYEDRHEPEHKPRLNQGPVIKINNNQRYATSGETAALFASLCQQAQVPYQQFVNRTDLACGTTIGPIAAARLGVRTVDVGNPMLSMHSIREQAGALDHPHMVEVMTRFLRI